MSGMAAGGPLPAMFSQTSAVKEKPAPLCLLSAFSGVRLSKSCWSGVRTGGKGIRKGLGLVIVARVYRSSSGGSRRQFVERSVSSQEIDPALDIDSIQSPSVRLIDEEQKMVGVVSINKAIQMAEDAELDLVILSADADPPVVRLMDYRKYKYEQQKKKREQQKKSAASRADVKELKMGCNIDIHDYAVRLRAAKRFLKDGDKVKIIVQFKGRESNFRENTISLFERFQNDLGKMAVVESKNFADRIMSMVLTPNKAVLEKDQEETNITKILQENPITEVSAGV
uniref:Translation initiation factor IF-3 n=1 Tax=Araucaria cunninghamii TaxID=56994 RepID=A0A0D6QZY3_ARACU